MHLGFGLRHSLGQHGHVKKSDSNVPHGQHKRKLIEKSSVKVSSEEGYGAWIEGVDWIWQTLYSFLLSLESPFPRSRILAHGLGRRQTIQFHTVLWIVSCVISSLRACAGLFTRRSSASRHGFSGEQTPQVVSRVIFIDTAYEFAVHVPEGVFPSSHSFGDHKVLLSIKPIEMLRQ